MHSLRFRLLMTLVVVVVVAVGTVAVFTSRSTTSQFQRYVARDIERDQRVLEAVLQSYQEGEDRQNVQALVKRMAHAAGDRIVVVDNTGRVIADSAGQLVGQTLPLPTPFSPPPPPWTPGEQPAPGLHGTVAADVPFLAPIFVRVAPALNAGPGAPVPDFIVARAPIAGPGSSEAAFLGSMNRSLLLAVAAAGLVALLLTAALSRRILAPIESLTAAARKMEKGDLSQRVRVQSRDEIGSLAHAFNAMADGLGRLEGLRRNMVTDIAHELRTPLTNIRGYLEALRDGVVQPDPAIIDSLHEEALLLSRLVEDLQDLAVAEAGQLRLAKAPVDLHEIVAKSVNAMQPLLVGKGLVIIVDLPPDLPPVEVDAERVGQMLRNLLNNAVTHTPPGGTIAVAARAEGAEVAVDVRDTGAGISADDLPYIFERFYRADRSRARTTGGAGLGLAIVKQLAEAHGGRVEVQSSVGDGTTFTITLPVAEPGERAASGEKALLPAQADP